MYKVTEKLFIGSDADCNYTLEISEQPEFKWATIHACKTCHKKALGYQGNMDKNSGLYLVFEKLDNLFLNIVDMQQPLLAHYALPIFTAALDFIERKIPQCDILIHCNKGLSRAPTIALLYLAKRLKTISNKSFNEAKQEFLKIIPSYEPCIGSEIFLTNHWEEIV
ncbi:hypothetical protein LCGC14_1179700 [marine sediment metagenome]|uniref:Tyrosine specific protein phosphatases domain-containing protein n=1 Tax=marine sediment metagenome TaxID=412755 RepID=A0A0F9LSD4_9ZZZZ